MKGCFDVLMDLALLPHKDKDVGVFVALYINEMIKIVVSKALYNDDSLKETFWFAMFVVLCKTSFHIVSLEHLMLIENFLCCRYYYKIRFNFIFLILHFILCRMITQGFAFV
jgi:hypothetical protein